MNNKKPAQTAGFFCLPKKTIWNADRKSELSTKLDKAKSQTHFAKTLILFDRLSYIKI